MTLWSSGLCSPLTNFAISLLQATPAEHLRARPSFSEWSSVGSLPAHLGCCLSKKQQSGRLTDSLSPAARRGASQQQ
jgi:hypothetical protein